MGYEAEFSKLGKCSEVLMLHLFCRLTSEMSDIASQSKTNPAGTVQGFEDPAKANENLRKAIGALRSELGQFKSSRRGLVGYGIETLTSWFGSLVVKQGTGSIFDVSTDAVALLQPAWQQSLSPLHPAGSTSKSV